MPFQEHTANTVSAFKPNRPSLSHYREAKRERERGKGTKEGDKENTTHQETGLAGRSQENRG